MAAPSASPRPSPVLGGEALEAGDRPEPEHDERPGDGEEAGPGAAPGDLAEEALARELAALPQRCLRSDRWSVRQQWGRSQAQALLAEFDSGLAVLTSGESAAGAARFVGGAGRGGEPV